MTTEADILAVLTGRKVFDGAKWRVYAPDGSELADPGGVLWKSVHGALLWAQVAVDRVVDTATEAARYYTVGGMTPQMRRRLQEEDEVLLAVLQMFVMEA